MLRDYFHWKKTQDLEILGNISPRRTLIRCSVPNVKPEPQRHFNYAICMCDGLGWPQTDEGLVMDAKELHEFASALNKLIESGEIKDGCTQKEFESRVEQREEFERRFNAAHPRGLR